MRWHLGLLTGSLLLAIAGCQAGAAGLAAPSNTKASAQTTSGGTVVLAGGGLADDNRDLWESLYQAARKTSPHARPRIAVVGSGRPSLQTASEAFYQDDGTHLSYQHLFVRYGFEPVFVPIAIDVYRSAAYDAKNVALIDEADAVWFGGGSQAYHARSFLKDDGSDTPLMAAVRRLHARGGVVGGTSAGAAVMDEQTYGEGKSHGYFLANSLVYKPLSAMHDAEDASLATDGPGGGYTRGLGMVRDLDAGVDTHVDARGRYGRIMVAMRALQYRYGIALSENTALFIKGKRGVVRGADRVVITDGSGARYGAGRYFAAENLRLSSLRQDDTFDFASGTAASAKASLPAGFQAPGFDAGNVFGGDEVPKALETLAAGTTSEAEGTSRETSPAAFRLILKRSPQTSATLDPVTGRITALHVTATVSP